jgi:hypothetical protein
MENLLRPREVDLILRYPAGRTLRLAKKGLITSIILPDGEVRIPESAIEILLGGNQQENHQQAGGDNGR